MTDELPRSGERRPMQSNYSIDSAVREAFRRTVERVTGKKRRESAILEGMMREYIEKNGEAKHGTR